MLKFNLIAAVGDNLGNLPWKLRSKLKYFGIATKRWRKPTKRKRWRNPTKRNAVVVGRKTYFGKPDSERPVPQRLNIVVSTTLKPDDLPQDVLLYPNRESALQFLEIGDKMKEQIGTELIGGGRGRDFKEVALDPEIPKSTQEENNLKYEYKILEKQ